MLTDNPRGQYPVQLSHAGNCDGLVAARRASRHLDSMQLDMRQSADVVSAYRVALDDDWSAAFWAIHC